MIQLANILHARGFVIDIVHTKYNFPNPSKYPQFNFHLLSDGLSEAEISTSGPIHLIKLLIGTCVDPFYQFLGELLSDDLNNRVTCLITDAIWYFTQAAADKFKLPRIVLRTTSICPFLALSAFPLLQEKGYLSNCTSDSEMEDAIPELPPLKVKDIPIIETQDPDNMFHIIASMVGETKKARGLIFNTFEELEEPELVKLQSQFLMPTFAVGPFRKCFLSSATSLLTQDISSISWLDKQSPKSVLYVSFGSIASMDDRKLLEMACGLANSTHPFLWVVRPGLVHGSEWIEMLPSEFLSSVGERGYIVKWAPQQEVLSHPAVGGFWTHSGWNSTLESICEGVPMICSPFFGDQRVNSRYVNDVWKIGIKLEKGMEREEIEDAIRTLMVGEKGEEMRKRVVCMKEKVDLCLSSGGSSYRALDGLIDFISSFESSV
ncbi:UDP-glycosyltransferase 76f1 [Phtheirospermum japonicum]|uniref:UDP-glycosyltransferase 76f1 n=1 Tax=Phtheirospermum japonicum TaxID=374723 RepID=A0A830BHF2_9LAMI|nr:UDP-glycosyltransferase 76f1 [Phtheirospermum japonicum]